MAILFLFIVSEKYHDSYLLGISVAFVYFVTDIIYTRSCILYRNPKFSLAYIRN